MRHPLRYLLTAGLALAAMTSACGVFDGDNDDGSASNPRPESTAGTEGGPSPDLEGPASRFVPFVDELPESFEVNPPETFTLTDDIWSRLGPFESASAGGSFIEEHGFVEGQRVLFNPDGQLAGVVGEGRYYATIETYLFEDEGGAEATFGLFEEQGDSISGSEQVDMQGLANQSGAWEFVEGTVGNTDSVGIYHRFIFRRGNLFALVQTYGAQEHMSADAAREIAALIDNRALGETEAAEPTPIDPVLPTQEPDQTE